MTTPAPECVALAEGLRQVRARTGLSLAALAERTVYSKSSWERYLNGKTPPPRHAVEELCAIAREPAGRLLALWELADAEWSGRARQTRPAAPTPLPVSAPVPAGATGPTGVHGRVRRRWLFIAGAGVAAVAITATLTAPAVQDHSAGQPSILVSPEPSPPPGCRGKACEGKDPTQMLCGLVPGRADTVGAQHLTRSGARVEIRYSSVCAAAWGLIWHSRVGDGIEISAPGRGTRPGRVVIRNSADTVVYRVTPMIGSPDRTGLRLCFTPAGGTGEECFGS
ncbi:helix-turn-helix domain-containing protein [Streptomyces sp900129855]|uniref:Helix-turn-helix domain-containing protein n=1 Tax=Streptomyces sp. 900129855 TaxID=3155129 RepID=A0ABV2ZUW6_9ACTN